MEAPGVPAFLAEAWAAASRKPAIRDMVGRCQQRIVTTATILLQEGVAAGELAARLDVDRAARAIAALLDGVVLECLASGGAPSRRDVERRVLLLVGPTAEPLGGPGSRS